MPVFDFSNSPEKAKVSECTYTVFRTNAPFTSPDQPILILDTKEKAFPHHPCGIFTNPSKRTSFEFKNEEETFIADILQIDARFVSLLKWLGENHQCPPFRHTNIRRLCSLQNPRDRFRWRRKAFG